MAIIPPKTEKSADLQELLSQKFEVKPASRGWLRIACPTCSSQKDSRKFKRYVNAETGYSNCFICDKKMNFASLLGVQGVQFKAASKPEEHPMSRQFPFKAATPVSELPPCHRAVQFLCKDHLFDLARYSDEYGIVFVDYEDGLEIETASGYPILIAECIIFPVFHRDELVGWQARFIPGHHYSDRMGKMKYFHIYPKGEYLFNYDKAKQYDFVVLVEGIKKALKFDACVASLGKGVSETQLKLLREWEYVVIMLDGDEATQTKARKLTAELRASYVKAVNVNPSDYGKPSPDEMTSAEVTLAIAEALASINYKPKDNNETDPDR